MGNLLANFTQNHSQYCRFVPVSNFDYSVNISIRYNYVYIETPKVGCSTIKSILQKMELNDPTFFRSDFEDIHNRQFSPLLKPSQLGDGLERFIRVNKPFVFCFSRNPYSRLLSSYLDKINGDRPQKLAILLHLGKDVSKLDQPISFEEFVNAVCEQPIPNMDAHWRVQFYQTFQDAIEYDFTGKFENFTEDLHTVLHKISPDHERFLTTEKRHAQNANALLSDYYTPELARLVQEKFAMDFDHFKYSRDVI